MTEKKSVRVDLRSESEDGPIRQSMRGELYDWGDRFYVRYQEKDPAMGQTETTVKCEPGQIKVIRRGDVESVQTFQLRRKLRGTYRTDQGGFLLENETHSMQIHKQNNAGFIAWRYDLFVAGQFAGTFAIKLEFVEGES